MSELQLCLPNSTKIYEQTDRELLLMLQETQENGRRRKADLEEMKRLVQSQLCCSSLFLVKRHMILSSHTINSMTFQQNTTSIPPSSGPVPTLTMTTSGTIVNKAQPPASAPSGEHSSGKHYRVKEKCHFLFFWLTLIFVCKLRWKKDILKFEEVNIRLCMVLSCALRNCHPNLCD